MNLKLYITEGCTICTLVEKQIRKISDENLNLRLNVIDIEEPNHPSVMIVPALFVEDELYSYGEFDINKFKKLVALAT